MNYNTNSIDYAVTIILKLLMGQFIEIENQKINKFYGIGIGIKKFLKKILILENDS